MLLVVSGTVINMQTIAVLVVHQLVRLQDLGLFDRASQSRGSVHDDTHKQSHNMVSYQYRTPSTQLAQ